MSRGDKNYSKITHDLVKGKGKSSQEKKKALHKMVEALIAEKTDEAQAHLHNYLKLKTREILVGESDDEGDNEQVVKGEEKEKKDEKDKDDKELDREEKNETKAGKKQEKEIEDDDEEDDEEEDEDKEDVKEDFPFGHPAGAMDRNVKGTIKFATKGKSGMLKHNNAAKDLDMMDVKDINFKGSGKKSGALRHGNNAPGLEDHPKGNVFKDKVIKNS